MSDDGCIVRPAASGDGPELFAMIADHARFEGSSATLTGEGLQRILTTEDPPVNLLVAVSGRSLAGFAAVTFDYSLWRGHRWAHLDCLFVHETWRGRSIGTQLLHHAIDRARSRGADRIEWQTPAWNERAKSFYEGCGARSELKLRFGMTLGTGR